MLVLRWAAGGGAFGSGADRGWMCGSGARGGVGAAGGGLRVRW